MNCSHWYRFLVCLPVLVWAHNATAQVTAAGPACHQAAVRDALVRIRASHPEVAQILKDLEDAKYECRVVPKTAGPAVADTSGGHVIIGWPGQSGRRHADGSCVDADASLVHELHHCWVRSKHGGDEPCNYVLTRTVSGELVSARASCEFDAVRLENRYRKAIGICERIAYDIFQVPGAERTCEAKEAVCRPISVCSNVE
jgi:hypothetical protein